MSKDYNISVKADFGEGTITKAVAPLVAQAIQSSMQTSLALIRDKWQREAQSKLKSSLPLYIEGLQFNSIQYPYKDNFSGAVILRGKLPNMFEQGFSSYDMKRSFANSPKKHTTKDGGWYVNIPYRHMTPGAYMYGSTMPQTIHNRAKKLGPYNTTGDRLVDNSPPKTNWAGYTHKTSIYDGMVKIVKSYQKATQSHYMTFRRVSNKSDSNAWKHPGYAGAKIAESIVPYAEKTFETVLNNNMAEIK